MNRILMERTALLAALSLLLSFTPGKGNQAQGLLQLLQPGSRPCLWLGGDPFLSHLADDLGWWRTLDPRAGSWVRLARSENAPLTPRMMRGAGQLSGQRSEVTSAWRLGSSERTAVLLTQINRLRSRAAWQIAGDDISLAGEGENLLVGARLSGWLNGLTIQAAGPVWRENSASVGATTHLGVRYGWRRQLVLQVAWDGTNDPLALTSLIEGEVIAAPLNLRRETLAYDGRLRIWRSLSTEVRYQRSLAMRTRDISQLPWYEIAPGGRSAQYQLTMTWRDEHQGGLLGRLTRHDHELAGESFWGGQRFGELNYARFDLESRLLAGDFKPTTRSRILAEWEHCKLTATGRGEIESWPFTATLVDLLGLRRIFRGTAQIDWTRWHLGGTLDRPGAEFQAGLTWYSLSPQANLVSWRPLFLVFGRTDVRIAELDITRVDLGALSAGVALPLGRASCELSFQQFIFARIVKAETASEGPSDPEGTNPASTPRGWIGGSYVHASISFAW